MADMVSRDEGMTRVWAALEAAGEAGLDPVILRQVTRLTTRQVAHAVQGIRAMWIEEREQPLTYLFAQRRWVLAVDWKNDQLPATLSNLRRLQSETRTAHRTLAAAWAKWPAQRRQIRRLERDFERFAEDLDDLLVGLEPRESAAA